MLEIFYCGDGVYEVVEPATDITLYQGTHAECVKFIDEIFAPFN